MKTQKNIHRLKFTKLLLALITLSLSITLTPTATAQLTIEEREAKAKRIQQLYLMAEQAYRDADIDVARDTLRTVLAEQPGHAHSIALLRKIRLNGSQFEITKKKNKFNAVIIKSIEYKGVNLRQALKILNEQVMVASGKKVTPNFVLSDPKRYMGAERIELTLKNVPAGVVLDHLMKKTATNAKFGKYSITIKPRDSAYKNKAKPKAEVEDEEEEEEKTEPSKEPKKEETD